mmetsp:Transcript_18701/g.60446  ORF Transcript_18701/g.60446 Transcript_18701/m.60446 type:complete len:273 (+) Transcript_18701:325-1143(+)
MPFGLHLRRCRLHGVGAAADSVVFATVLRAPERLVSSFILDSDEHVECPIELVLNELAFLTDLLKGTLPSKRHCHLQHSDVCGLDVAGVLQRLVRPRVSDSLFHCGLEEVTELLACLWRLLEKPEHPELLHRLELQACEQSNNHVSALFLGALQIFFELLPSCLNGTSSSVIELGIELCVDLLDLLIQCIKLLGVVVAKGRSSVGFFQRSQLSFVVECGGGPASGWLSLRSRASTIDIAQQLCQRFAGIARKAHSRSREAEFSEGNPSQVAD